MDRKEAIERIKRHMIVHQIGEYPHIKLAEALSMAIAALQEPQVGGWIPVTERLPEEEGRYLCAYGKNLMCVYSFSNDLFSVDDYDFAKYKFEKKKGFYAYDSEWGYCEVDFIKAWQPLPEPFKEEKDV